MSLEHSPARDGNRAGATGKARVPPVEPLTITVQQATQMSGLCEATIWNRIADETLKTRKVGRRRLIIYTSYKRMLLGDAEAA